jgi:GNAT superfamily N-acetyltransferase
VESLATPEIVDISIRPMAAADLPAVAALAIQLGYNPTTAEVAERFDLLQPQRSVGFDVAHASGCAGIMGWIHVYGVHTLVSTPYAEIGGIVVDEAGRLAGIGRALMYRAERWAREHGYQEVRLRSGHHRLGAHRFYHQIGYEVARPSHTFRRFL